MKATIIGQGRNYEVTLSCEEKLSLYLLGIFLIYISNAIPKVPHTLPPTPLPTHTHFLALALPSTGAYKVSKSNGPLFTVIANKAKF